MSLIQFNTQPAGRSALLVSSGNGRVFPEDVLTDRQTDRQADKQTDRQMRLEADEYPRAG